MRVKTLLLKIAWAIVLALFILGSDARAQSPNSGYSQQMKNFAKALSEVGMTFDAPQEFKEVTAVNTREFPFNYAMEMPGQNFEIWFKVSDKKADEKFIKQNHLRIPTDSAYNAIALRQASIFADDKALLPRNIPNEILTRYSADAGKIYLLNLKDLAVTKHYKYALLIVLAKSNTGTLLAVCFTNNKGPEFFKNMYQASNCLKFAPATKAQN